MNYSKITSLYFSNTLCVYYALILNKHRYQTNELERLFLRPNFKLIAFTAYHNNLDIRINFQFFSKF